MDGNETDTWYVLADGTHAHPADVERGDDGVLKSKGGVPVSLRENGVPLTSGVATKSNKEAARAGRGSRSADAKAAAEAKAAEAKAAEAKAAEAAAAGAQGSDAVGVTKPGDQQGAGYATRESKAE